ncbi:response regulator [Candidatus Woesearchaeota archaeon]|nr:response regulator [Candidatus Woesearchaeota archaeon]
MAKKTIMVVDDEPDTLELAKAILTMNGFNVQVFDTAKGALDALKAGKAPDLIILDMRMPQISGPDFCEKVRTELKLTKQKIVFFTASSFKDNALVKKYKVLGYIFKPFDNDKLVEDIKKFLSK